ncbi:hypothetical protein Csa_005367, partial [Cucumis sativus]
MYSQGLDMPPDEMLGTRQSSEGRNCSSGSKRKHGGQHYEAVDVISNEMEVRNDQLKAIANWSKEKRATEVELHVEVVKQLQDISELRTRDRVKLMQIIFHMVDDIEGFLSCPTKLKLEYCRVLLEDN